jgi:chemotaxis protein MotB
MARKKIVYIEPARNNTIVLYGSLFLLILTFFVALSSMSILDNKRMKMAIGSISGSFGVLPGGRSPFSTDGSRNTLPQRPPIESGWI